jgi:hypothetical protein
MFNCPRASAGAGPLTLGAASRARAERAPTLGRGRVGAPSAVVGDVAQVTGGGADVGALGARGAGLAKNNVVPSLEPQGRRSAPSLVSQLLVTACHSSLS